MNRFQRLYDSVVGRKLIAATTGFLLLGFLFLHAFGNLNSFAGPGSDGIPAINAYAGYLRDLGTPLVPSSMLLWLVRILLIVAVLLHLITVISLMRTNRAARSVHSKGRRHQHTSFATHWVVASGLLLLLFIVTHVMQMAFGLLTPFDFTPGDVYHNLNSAFQHGWLVVFYLSGLAALGLHLHHGVWSLFQTLGVNNPDRNAALRLMASVTTVVLVTVFASTPLAFYFSLVRSMG